MAEKPPIHRPRTAKAPTYNARPSASSRGYDRKWRAKRVFIYVRDCGRCQYPGCGALVGRRGEWHIDHIVPKSRGGSDAEDNLQLLCASCHGRKTAIEDGGFGHAAKLTSTRGRGSGN